jgi:glycosyltransferase involved in cell wall biosynthesis
MADIRVLLLTRYDRLGASSRLRFDDYIPLLPGFSITRAPFFDDAYLSGLYSGRKPATGSLVRYYARRLKALRRIPKFDLVWLEKEALPWLPGWIEHYYLKRKPYAVDLDDAWFLRYDQHPDPLVRGLLQGKFTQLVRRAAVTIAGNDYLAGWANANGARHVARLPTTVDPARYGVAATKQAKFTIGWMGSPSSAKYLAPIAPALAQAQQELDADIVLVGSGPIQLDGVAPTLVEWREEDEAAQLASFDIGIMPLDADRWSEGKCAYKLIQYMAAGLPVIASPIGMNREVIAEGENGFLASTNAEWFEAFRTVHRDPALRQGMGQAGRARVERDYNLHSAAVSLAATLKQAAGLA